MLGMFARLSRHALSARWRRFYAVLRDGSPQEGHLSRCLWLVDTDRWSVDWHRVYMVLVVDIGAS